MIQTTRICRLNSRPELPGSFVLYWMQQSQRGLDNHALEFAVEQANRLKQPLFVFFFLTPSFPEAYLRHYVFMLQGLEETRRVLEERKIPLIIRSGSPPEELLKAAAHASLAVTDRGYLAIQRQWRNAAAEQLSCPLIQVESDAVVPVETAYPKEAYTAAVLRPRIHRLLFAYMEPLKQRILKNPAGDPDLQSLDISDPESILIKLGINPAVGPVTGLRGGTSRAEAGLDRFIREDLDRFETDRNDPGKICASGLSPYLHFGQISPLSIALKILAADSPGKETFLEELIVRRELALNFTHYNENYRTYESLHEWCRKTLEKHAHDKREYLYTPDDLEAGSTHDPYWNAAQKELVLTGRMHGYMRMYWGKKILEWNRSPREAYSTAVLLNNRYGLDGRDPASFAGIAWCFGKHDRPWTERSIFGTIRYMNDKGLERKFHMPDYLERIGKLS